MNSPLDHKKLLKGATGDWEIVLGMEIHAQVTADRSCSPARRWISARAQRAGQPRRCGHARHAAGDQPECVAQAVRSGLGLKAKINPVALRPEELLLSGPAAGLSDQPVQGPDRRRGRGRGRARRRLVLQGRHRAAASGAGRRQVAPRPGPRRNLRRSQPRRHRADGDRLLARHALGRRGGAYVKKLRTILRYLGTCDGDMEKGNLRADVNVSVRRPGEPLGTRCEIKNVNSIRFIGQAIESRGAPPDRHHRGRRQDRPGDAAFRPCARARPARCARRKRRTTIAISPIPTCCRWSSTRPMWTSCRRICRSCRTTSSARFMSQYGLSAYDAAVLVTERAKADYFEAAVGGQAAHARRQAGRQLGHQRPLRPPRQGRPGDRAAPGLGVGASPAWSS